jgi:hypothetical protein
MKQELLETNQKLETQNDYHIVFKNCSTELVETHEEVTENKFPINLHRKLAMIPAQSSFLFENNSSHTVNSYRIQNKNGSIWESVTFLSSTYHYQESDGFFVFFTEEAFLSRPILGTFNLLAGFGQIIWGGLKLPLDQGREIKSGAYSVLYSLPELIFFNIRKGSNEPIGNVTIPNL